MTKSYGTILMDPPWWTPGDTPPAYPMVRDKDMLQVIRNSGAFNPKDDAMLFCWALNSRLPFALSLVEDLGFRYVTMFTWAKDTPGIGRYVRGQSEHLLLAVRGSPGVPRVPWKSTLIPGKKRGHSVKPDEAFGPVEYLGPKPWIELFARRKRPGWDSWGNEVESDN